MFLSEDRKGLSLGTDILWWATPCSHRQDLIFAFLSRGTEGKQKLLTSTVKKRLAWVMQGEICFTMTSKNERKFIQHFLILFSCSFLSTMNFCLLDV